ncbi:ESX secretion-associated protein EspG [Actinosynnema sp.]|uniref:ESX secretion-associated protein EspG n=1 Tax=Actinosynnema sp. TaxID=1872144 RepID=UPI003F8683BB
MDYFGGAGEPEPITLSAEEFDVLWERFDAGPMPLVIKVPSPGKTYSERAQLEDRVWRSIGARGLGGPRGLHPELDFLLRTLIRPEREVDARLWLGRSVRVLAAANGDHGSLATLVDGHLTFRRTAGTGLPAAVVAALPKHPAGTGHSVTLPSADLEAAVEGSDNTTKGIESALRAKGLREADATALAKRLTNPVGTGNFGAAARDRYGKRCRPDRVVGFFDNEEGRFLQQRRTSQGAEAWSTFTPTDNRRLAHQVDELLTEAMLAAGQEVRR